MSGRPESERAFQRAKRSLVGGVNSPVRAFGGVGGTPVFIERGQGPYLWDLDGNRYVDYVLSYGPLIVGHSHPEVVSSLRDSADAGTSYGAPTVAEIELAETIKGHFTGMDQIRFVNSGTEATMSALRLARAATGRSKIVKFRGCYHGHADLLLVQAGSGVTTLGLPDSPGVPRGTTADTLVAEFNHPGSVGELFNMFPDEIAAVIIEPVAGNMGVVPPQSGFLKQLRSLTQVHGTLLIFDEVMTGFRAHPSGAQVLYGVQPDLTVLGKVIGGGLPVGAYGGPKEIMGLLAPEGPVYQAGTLSGNPVAMRAGLTTLRLLAEGNAWEQAAAVAKRISEALLALGRAAGIPVSGHQVGTMMSLFFTPQAPSNYDSVRSADTDQYARFFHSMLDSGVYLAPSQFEAAFTSSAHDEEAIEVTLRAAELAFDRLNLTDGGRRPST